MKRSIFLLYVSLFVCDCLASIKSDEDFLDFLIKFSSNKEFQAQRINFPIEKHTYTKELKDTAITIDRSTWKYQMIIQTKIEYITDISYSFNDDNEISNERVFIFIGIETGMNIKYYFKRINGLWYLVRLEDYST